MTRIDAHHHVWDLGVRDEPWISGTAMQPIRRNFDVADLHPHADAAGVTATVLVQTLSSFDETRDFLRLADSNDLIAAVTGWVDLTASSVADDLAALRESPGGAYLRAIRHQVHDEPDGEWLAREAVHRGLAALGEAGLAYELLIFPNQLEVATATAAAFSDYHFVLDHCAKPRIAAGQLEPWAGQLRVLSALENVTCKLSGLVTEANWDSWTVDDLRPYTDVVLDAFGPERVMFGSDWPVCTLAASYPSWVNAADQLTATLSASERDAVFRDTARRVYDLDQP